MRFLDLPPLARINGFLDHVDCGNYIVKGDLEAYSCKLAGLDKKLSKSLDSEVQMGTSPVDMTGSPVGPLTEVGSRKTLIYLILTLNHIYPDYDFSQLRAHHFKKLEGRTKAEETIDSHLLEVSQVWSSTPGFGDTPFLESLWTAIEEAIDLKCCDVYCYESDQDTDPFGENTPLWSFNYFFYNKALKRILYFSCRACSKMSAEDEEGTETSSKGVYDDTDSDADDKYGMAGSMDT